MKLFFWRKAQPTSQSVEKPVSNSPRQKETQQSGSAPRPSGASQKEVKRYRILPLKRRCETELTPLAWSRVVIRLLPVLRDFNCDFSQIQKPNAQTDVEREVYMLLLATIEEIYGKTFTPKDKPKLEAA